MYRVQGVSFPRSGHHLLVKCVKQYFGKRLGYCGNVFRGQDFPSDGITLQKNHDFDLTLPISSDARYLIQYRHPLEAIASWYRWEVKHGIAAECNYGWRPFMNRYAPVWNLYTKRSNQRRWSTFLESKILFWSGFMGKWLIGNTHPATCFVDYSELVRNPLGIISEVVLFFDPETPLDTERLAKVIGNNKVKFCSRITDFEFYDERLFRDIEKTFSASINSANIGFIFSDLCSS